jgi:protoporphyrinogen/coproporphyrinogen III oxidase
MATYAVVGAGPAGLAAAWQLQATGAAVTVYEAAPSVGGRVRSDTVDGTTADVGPQLLGSTFHTLFRLLDKAGASPALVRAPGRDALWRKGRAQPLTYGSIASMTASGALPMSLKLRLGTRYLPFLARHARGLDVSDLAGSGGASLDEESVERWGKREIGDDFVELLACPLLASYYGSLPEETSAVLLHALAQAGMDVQVLAAAGGLGGLMSTVAAALRQRGVRILSSCAASGIESTDDGVVVHGPDGEHRCDGVVVATPAAPAAKLLGAARPGSAPLISWLASVRNRPAVTLALFLDGAVDADFFGLSFPRTDPIGERVAALCVQSRKLPTLVATGREAVVVLPAPRVGEALADAEPDAIVDALLPAAARALPGLERLVARARTHRFEAGYTLFGPGSVRAVERFQDGWLPAGVALAGDYLYAPNIEGAVRSGVAAAVRLAGKPA